MTIFIARLASPARYSFNSCRTCKKVLLQDLHISCKMVFTGFQDHGSESWQQAVHDERNKCVVHSETNEYFNKATLMGPKTKGMLC